MSILDEILGSKRAEVERESRAEPMDELERRARARTDKPRGFGRALETAAVKPAVIAEIKRKSPSGGFLKKDADAAGIARGYERAGATCLSVLTDGPYFAGSLEDLARVRAAVRLPLLRKDFVIDPYQIVQSYAAGADAVLLITGALEPVRMRQLHDAARAWGLDVLAEVHSEEELERASALPGAILGINNRDLRTFDVSLETTRRLAAKAPKGRLIVSESGIRSRRDLETARRCGADAVLVGESLMIQPDPGLALEGLLAPC